MNDFMSDAESSPEDYKSDAVYMRGVAAYKSNSGIGSMPLEYGPEASVKWLKGYLDAAQQHLKGQASKHNNIPNP